MELIDTHTHLFLPEFSADLEQVVDRALHAGVTRMYLPNVDSSTFESLLSVADKYPGICFPMMGIHPTSIKENFREELHLAGKWLSGRTFAGIGETGIDLYWDTTFRGQQMEAFEEHISWARQYDLPLIIHSRNSISLILDILSARRNENIRGVFHCFTGNYQQAVQAMNLGFMLGIGGVVTYKNGGLDTLLPQIGLSSVVLETDAPYLPPVPHRGKRNESSYLCFIAEKIAGIMDITADKVAETTTSNARKLFRF